MIPEGHVTIREAAFQLDTTPDVVRVYLDYGVLRSYEIGPSLYVNSEDLAGYRRSRL